MPIRSISKEAKLEVLIKDTRDFCNLTEDRYKRFFRGASEIRNHDVVRFLESFSDTIPSEVVHEHLRGRVDSKVKRLFARAQADVRAAGLKSRWYEAFQDWDGMNLPVQRDNISLSTQPWER